jgi:hypothetical protein
MSDVSAPVQSWRKFRPANSFAHAESQVSSKWKNMVQDEEAAFKGSSWLCTVQVLSALHFPCVVVVHDHVLHSCFARRHLSLVLDCLSPQSPNYHPQGSNLSPWSSMNSLINLNLQASSCSMHHTWWKFNLGLFLLGCCDHSSLMEKATEEGFVSCWMSDCFSLESCNCVEIM